MKKTRLNVAQMTIKELETALLNASGKQKSKIINELNKRGK